MTWIKSKDSTDVPRQRAEVDYQPAAGTRRGAAYGQVHIGSSMQITGELTGQEDLTIDGRVDGKIFLNGHTLTVARNGEIRAEIRDAASVVVHGEMIGNITATDRVEVAETGSMLGDIRAPRVVLADGGRFKGCIDMEPDRSDVRPADSHHERKPHETSDSRARVPVGTA